MKKELRKIEVLRQAYDRTRPAVATLRSQPSDPAANHDLGWFYAVYKDDWEEALPLLAKGSDERWRSMAQRDLKTPDDPAKLLSLADQWQHLAGSHEGPPRIACLRRAHACYRAARRSR